MVSKVTWISHGGVMIMVRNEYMKGGQKLKGWEIFPNPFCIYKIVLGDVICSSICTKLIFGKF